MTGDNQTAGSESLLLTDNSLATQQPAPKPRNTQPRRNIIVRMV